ncbi:MAG TPA: glycosyltransferase family 39 protein [Polyangiaceae bacterium]
MHPARQSPTRVERLAALGPVAVLVASCASLVIPLARYGLWDPHELRAIDLARRIALHWFGATDLEIDGVANTLPSRGEVDRGELPFTSMAVGLRLFGLEAWAGRLPLAVWAMLGLVATYALVARLADRAAAALSVLVLATMPLYFAHARTMLGDAVTMAGLALAVAGLALALFDSTPRAARLTWFAVGLVGLASGGLSRGLLLGVAVPALGVGLGWVTTRMAGAGRDERLGTALAALVLAIGAAATLFGLAALQRALHEPERYFATLGFGYSPPASAPTFDAVVHQLGHGLFPWSALLPPALARLALSPGGGEPAGPVAGLRATLVMVLAVAVTAWGGLAPYAGVLPFGAVAPLAILVALVLRDIDLGAPASRAFGLMAAALALLLLVDFRNFPEELLSVFGLGALKFPESFRDVGSGVFALGTVGAAGLFVLATQEGERSAPLFSNESVFAWFRTLRDLWNGNLLFGLLVVEAAALGFMLFELLGRHVAALERFVTRSELFRPLALYGFLVVPALVFLPLLLMAARDAFRFVDRARENPRVAGLIPRRGSLAAAAVALFGAWLSLGYYPALADQLSPQESYEAYRRFARPGEPLGMIGTSSTLATHYAGRNVEPFRGAEEAYRWLLEPGGRRFLVLRADGLASLNARYRARISRSSNLPVLDAHTSEILLVSNQLRPGERNENPLDAYLLGKEPRPTRVVDANLGEQLDVLGWDVTDLDDRAVKDVVPRRRYRFVIYYRVMARISGTWETFLHIDGFQRRFNGDHKTLDGRYPFALWQVGDLIADRHEIELEPNFTPGTYQVYFGLYAGSRRMPVKRGAHHEDRVQGGPLVVR